MEDSSTWRFGPSRRAVPGSSWWTVPARSRIDGKEEEDAERPQAHMQIWGELRYYDPEEPSKAPPSFAAKGPASFLPKRFGLYLLTPSWKVQEDGQDVAYFDVSVNVSFIILIFLTFLFLLYVFYQILREARRQP
jgi:hypothetical protein